MYAIGRSRNVVMLAIRADKIVHALRFLVYMSAPVMLSASKPCRLHIYTSYLFISLYVLDTYIGGWGVTARLCFRKHLLTT